MIADNYNDDPTTTLRSLSFSIRDFTNAAGDAARATRRFFATIDSGVQGDRR